MSIWSTRRNWLGPLVALLFFWSNCAWATATYVATATNSVSGTTNTLTCNLPTNGGNCTGSGTPFACCTGSGTGTCAPTQGELVLFHLGFYGSATARTSVFKNSSCTGSGTPNACCTGSGTGTCSTCLSGTYGAIAVATEG